MQTNNGYIKTVNTKERKEASRNVLERFNNAPVWQRTNKRENGSKAV